MATSFNRRSLTATLVLVVGLATSLTATSATAERQRLVVSDSTSATADSFYAVVRYSDGSAIEIGYAPAPALLFDFADLRKYANQGFAQLAAARDNRSGAIVRDGAPTRNAWALSGWSPREPTYQHPMRVDYRARSLV